MQPDEIIKATEDFVKQQLSEDTTGHDWWHVERVRNMALHITKNLDDCNNLNILTIELAALLHDIADWKFCDGDEEKGPDLAREWLELLKCVDAKVIDDVCEIIRGVSFKGAGVKDGPLSLEGQIVQDADRLDAMGAIGVARAFAYGGFKKRPLHTPEVVPLLHDSVEKYKNKQSSTVNHFYEKLLLLKDRMHTKVAKMIAEERHQQMVDFLEEFFKEWDFKFH